MSFIAKLIAGATAVKGILAGTAEELQGRIEDTTKKVIKSSALFVVAIIAVIFVLVGLASAMQSYWQWIDGFGHIVVGVVLLLLVLIVKAFK